ncbi:MAG: hypothetical protein ABIK20_07425 [Candidatus Omnitrophota bacterium]
MVFVCSESNDLWGVLKNAGCVYPRFENLPAALQKAEKDSCLLVLADDYPAPRHVIDREFLEEAKVKSLRVYIEYPSALSGVETGEPRLTEWERIVTTSDFFSPAIGRDEILALHGCWLLPVQSKKCHLAAARVAGYRKAIYGIPEEIFPILFHHEEYPDVLVAASKLSNFVTGRYAPKETWRKIWERLLGWLLRTEGPPRLDWQMTVRPAFTAEEDVPRDVEEKAYKRVIGWFINHTLYSPAFSAGRWKGVIEGFESGIDYAGRQRPKTWPRSECISETGMLFACNWMLNKNPESKNLAGRMLDYILSSPDFLQNDPEKPVYGLINWYERGPAFYGAGQGRIIISALGASVFMKESRWDEAILRCLLANLRLTGPLGFQMQRFDYPSTFRELGWRYFRDEYKIINFQPHFQGFLWAANLWAYALTGCRSFFDRTANAIRMTMEAYPDKWQWTNGITQEMSRMLLPLAWLIRVDDKPEYREWLNRIFAGLYADMQPCGAIPERLGSIEMGRYPPPSSNEKYGTSEASLIQENGDPCCDLLYSMEYAFIGLHEAYYSTGDIRMKEAGDRMADFFCRIQVRSEAHPYLDGAWMRGFDYKLWEYWGSSADTDWGAWCVETGWTNVWIGITLALRKCGRSLFDTSQAERLRKKFPALLEEMSRGGDFSRGKDTAETEKLKG